MTQKPHQQADYFKVGDKVRTNEYHGLFYTDEPKEHTVIGTVLFITAGEIWVDWGRPVRHPIRFSKWPERYPNTYSHLPRYLDKADGFEALVQEYVNKELY